MPHILDILSLKFKQYYYPITITFVVAVFVLMSIYLYKNFMMKEKDASNDFKDVANTGNNTKEITIRMFHVDWCPHCVKALPEWTLFCNQYNGKQVNGYTINCNSNGDNCTDDASVAVAKNIADFNIVSYPTVVLIKDNKRYDFDAKISKQNLDQFVNSVTM